MSSPSSTVTSVGVVEALPARRSQTTGASCEPPTLARRFPVVPGARLYPLVPPLPVLSSLLGPPPFRGIASIRTSGRMEDGREPARRSPRPRRACRGRPARARRAARRAQRSSARGPARGARPCSVARTSTDLPSRCGSRVTSPSRSSACTRRDIVGAETCSARARRPTVVGPPKTSTESADRRAAVSPLSSSTRRTRRSTWIAAACSPSATSRGSGHPCLTHLLSHAT